MTSVLEFTDFSHVQHDLSAIKPAENFMWCGFTLQTDGVMPALVQATIDLQSTLVNVFFYVTKLRVNLPDSIPGFDFFIKKNN